MGDWLPQGATRMMPLGGKSKCVLAKHRMPFQMRGGNCNITNLHESAGFRRRINRTRLRPQSREKQREA
jgi:hypothetical protein